MQEKICPFPGLRPFTQEESIFFKGRELHIRQVINQLEERKFVMLTGASGDGKSSLVYAGVIPNASAGFFHAEYNNWLFVDFRPEREPIKNLARVFSDKLNIKYDTVTDKLQYGFSSIINLYKSSEFYIDKEKANWDNIDNYEKKKLKNKAANLFILADQFEEFFTNKENFNNGKPSNEAYTTVNLLLETARISIIEKLPVYVIFTMRSDYISQCVSFKGLPEFIGFSQFFIPRLKRNELQQIIEEPALLSGGKISSRLVEVLINELHDGFDQLPVLQHTLKSLWITAENGNSEIDLIHLAKLAGLDPKYLDENDLKTFNSWFENLDSVKKTYFKKQSLSNVLNFHANVLYLTAYEYFYNNIDWAEKNINEEDAKFIIKTVFQSLTKIDEGRAVRNRMTLSEITNIIDKHNISNEIVCGVLNIFRLPENTFVRPFIDEKDIATKYLSKDTILDITHEALIRNWELLVKWEEEEYQNLANFKDFSIQLNRWTESYNSNLFLLSSGNLSFFENWYNNSNLNPYWIAKYDNLKFTTEQKLENAEDVSAQTKKYLDESSKYLENIEKSKKQRRLILLISSFFAVIVLSVLTIWALNQKSKAIEQQKIAIAETQKADIARKEAEENAYLAELAKIQSDSARTIAEQMRELAEEKSALAILESQKALWEKNRADQQLIISEGLRKNAEEQKELAEQQKNKAEQQRSIAEIATEKAKQLSYLAIAQALTFKAEQNYNDPQINLLLSYLSYTLNSEADGKPNDAAIYDALYNSITEYGTSSLIFSSNDAVSSFKLFDNEAVEYISTNNKYFVYDYKNNKFLIQKDIKSSVPINEAFILNDKILLSYEDFSAVLLDLKTDETSSIKGHSDFIRAAVYSQNKNLLITGSRDKTVKIWDLSQKRIKEVFSQTFNEKITNLVINKNQDAVYGSTSNGEIFKIDLITNNYSLITYTFQMTSSLTISDNQEYLISGSLSGKVKIINLETFAATDIEIGKSKIDDIAIDKNSEIFAVASSDKCVNIYRFNDLESKPIKLTGFIKKISKLEFDSSGNLFGVSEDNMFYKWRSANNLLSNDVLGKISRNLTEEEWLKYVGSDVDYRKFVSE